MLLAYTPTPEFWALLTLIVSGITRFAWEAKKERTATRLAAAKNQAEITAANARLAAEIADREQTRLDLAAVASLTVEQLHALGEKVDMVNENGQKRLKVLLSSNVVTRDFAKKAIDTSNGIKTALMENGVKLVTEPAAPAIPSEVTPGSDPEHPLYVARGQTPSE